ncbi:MAG TPA: hypothetical protein PKK61_12200 [Defluviitaleaceae bacterium]|nr:hypothetical protein [Candidatus Epulonipiscium sp.]HOA81804.1 hypothetical protein [Defluviitaleaceae bacterium]
MYETGGGYTFIGEWVTGVNSNLIRVAIADGDEIIFAYINREGKMVWEMK